LVVEEVNKNEGKKENPGPFMGSDGVDRIRIGPVLYGF
jgi:hypothetical protein